MFVSYFSEDALAARIFPAFIGSNTFVYGRFYPVIASKHVIRLERFHTHNLHVGVTVFRDTNGLAKLMAFLRTGCAVFCSCWRA